MEYMEKLINVQIISYDKINQLRHVKYLKDKEHTLELMKKHAAIMGPKFKAVTETLAREVGPLGLATWHDPKGGYFVSVNTLPGLAKRTLALCKEAGVIMTGAGATFPTASTRRTAISASLRPSRRWRSCSRRWRSSAAA